MFTLLAAGFLVFTAAAVLFLLVLGYQQMCLERAETALHAEKVAERAAAKVAALATAPVQAR